MLPAPNTTCRPMGARREKAGWKSGPNKESRHRSALRETVGERATKKQSVLYRCACMCFYETLYQREKEKMRGDGLEQVKLEWLKKQRAKTGKYGRCNDDTKNNAKFLFT